MADPVAKVILSAERRGDAAFKTFTADLDRIATRAKIVGAAAGAALVLLTKHSFASIDALAKQADALAISTEKLAGLRLGASLAGIEEDQLTKALEKQRQTIFDASEGVAGATRALALLNLKAEDLIKLNTHEQFLLIADAISKVENSTQRGAIAADIFGAKNQKLLNFINEGRDAIEGYGDQAERLGIAISRIDAAKIEEANDAVQLARERMKGLGNTIAIEVAPIVTALAKAFVDATGDADQMGIVVRRVVDGIATGAGLVADAFFGWQVIFAAIRSGVLNLASAFVSAAEALREFDVKATAAVVDVLEIEKQTIQKRIDNIEKMLTHKLPELMRARLEKDLERLRQMPIEVPVEVDASSGISTLADSFKQSSEAALAQLEALTASEKPSIALAAALERARDAAQASAEAVARTAATRVEQAGAPTIGGDSEAEKRAKEQAQKARDAAERGLQQVNSILQRGFEDELAAREEFGLLTMEKELELREKIAAARGEVELAAHANRLEMLRGAFEAGLIDEERFADLSVQLAERTQERITGILREGLTEREKFEQMSGIKKAQFILGTLADITAGAAQHNKKMFELNKLAATANAIVNMYEGASKALAQGGFFGIAMAAAVITDGLGQIAAIRATTFQGGGAGTTPSAAGGSVVNGQPVPEMSDRDSGRRQVVITIHNYGGMNGLDSADVTERLTENIQDFLNRSDAPFLSNRSS